MKIQLQLLNEDAKVPLYSTSGAAGCDFYATEDFTIQPTQVKPVVDEADLLDASIDLARSAALFMMYMENTTLDSQLGRESASDFATVIADTMKRVIEGTKYPIELGRQVVSTGVALGIPIGSDIELELRSKSGLAFKLDVTAFNGTLDEDYEQEVKILVYNFSSKPISFKKGDKVAQGVFKKIIQADFDIVTEINREVVENASREANTAVSGTTRDGGFGSSKGVSALEV